jgi:hypothetical protein
MNSSSDRAGRQAGAERPVDSSKPASTEKSRCCRITTLIMEIFDEKRRSRHGERRPDSLHRLTEALTGRLKVRREYAYWERERRRTCPRRSRYVVFSFIRVLRPDGIMPG